MVSLKHAKESTLADSADESLIRPSDWNAEHVITFAAGDRLLGRADTPGDAQEIAMGDGLTLGAGGLSIRIDTAKGLAFVTGDLVLNIGSGLEFDGDGKLKTTAISVPDAIPSGAVVFVAQNSAPSGWLKANGAAVSRTTYAALFAAIGTTYGAGNGSTTFNLPDLRGEFVRGWDDGRGVDSGRAIGSAQAGAYESHSHTASTNSAGGHTHGAASSGATAGSTIIPSSTQTRGSVNYGTPTNTAGAHSHTVTVDASGGTETRPRNIALLACIKI
jgi:microcystin-dependent protein